jgi:S-(hydroxymethyl)mycothiol dehydrogenase
VVANTLGREAGRDGRDLRVVAGAPPPPGWAGKVWAMAQGLRSAGEAGSGPEYVLFTDADIAWAPGALRDLVVAAQGDDRDLVSQMALLRTATSWERVIVPAFVYFFAQLYPFRRVNRPASRTAAAAGGCMLVRRDALARAGGLAPIAGARIDDVALARLIKRGRGRTWLGLSSAVVSVRPYPRLASLWHMVARSAYIQLNYSPPLLAGTIAGLLFLYALPPAGAIAGLAAGAATTSAALAAGAGLAGWALMSLSYLPMLRLYRLSPLRAPGLPLIALLYAAMTVDSARRHYAGRGAEWKGRTDQLRCCRDRHNPREGELVTISVQGVVARGKGEPVELTTVLVPEPGPGEALVAVQACGVCHTDLHYKEGGIGNDFPYLLGHEAAGVVEAVGPDVTEVAPGDFVILNWRAVCGRCRACSRGRPWYCFNTHNASQKMTLEDGTPLSPALGIGAFAAKTLVASGQCTKVNPAIGATTAGLLGCGVMAGLGAALNTGGVTRGDSVAVIGCGGVGDGAILGARLAGARTIIAVDVDDRKLEWARGFGATDVVNSRTADPIERIRELTGGFGADVVIEAIGRPETYEQAFYARDLAGTVVLVGVPTPEMRLDLPLLDVFGRGGALKSSWYGDCLPSRDFPMLVDLHLAGRLPLDKFVSETIALGDVEEAFAKMGRGEVLRSVVVL